MRSMIKLSDVRVGSFVYVRGNFGSGAPVYARVTEVEEDVKNGFPGISYVCEHSTTKEGNWAYLNQVDRVVQY